MRQVKGAVIHYENGVAKSGWKSSSVEILYYANSQIAEIVSPAGFTISYAYDTDGCLTEISKDSTPLTTYRYDRAGRLEERENSNGVVTDYTYDELIRVTGITATRTGAGVI